MTKEAEVKMLDATIAKFGPHSYIGSWLADSRLGIVADINNDFTPQATFPATARADATNLLIAARKEADDILKAARAEADRLLDKARQDASDTRRLAARELERLAAQIGRGL